VAPSEALGGRYKKLNIYATFLEGFGRNLCMRAAAAMPQTAIPGLPAASAVYPGYVSTIPRGYTVSGAFS